MVATSWQRELANSVRSAESMCFILHGDTQGYVSRNATVQDFLSAMLVRPRTDDDTVVGVPVVLWFDRARGIRFADETGPNPVMRTAAKAVLTIGAPQENRPANPMAAALGLAGGGESDDPFADVGGDPLRAVRLIDRFLKAILPAREATLAQGASCENLPHPGMIGVVLDRADTILPDQPLDRMPDQERTLLVQLEQMATDRLHPIQTDAMLMIMIVGPELTAIHNHLLRSTSGWRAIKIKMPDEQARLEYIDWYTATLFDADLPRDDGLTNQALARLTAGLSLRHIEDILMRARASNKLSSEAVKERKDEIISTEFSSVASMIEPLPGGLDDVIGSAEAKLFFEREILAAFASGNLDEMPMGTLMIGPPGTGKTYLVAGLAGSARMNAVQLRTERIQDGIVGSSERNLRRFFDFALSLAPTIVFVDEIDQSDFGRRGQGSGNPVAANLFNMMLTFMSDPALRGRVLFIFASNRPELLDAAFKRSGRIDAKIPVLLPDEAQRAAIFAFHLKKRRAVPSDEATRTVVRSTVNYSAADLEALAIDCIKEARYADSYSASDDKLAIVTDELAQLVLDSFMTTSPQTANQYTDAALAEVSNMRYVPAEHRARAKLLRQQNKPAVPTPAASGQEGGPQRSPGRRWDV